MMRVDLKGREANRDSATTLDHVECIETGFIPPVGLKGDATTVRRPGRRAPLTLFQLTKLMSGIENPDRILLLIVLLAGIGLSRERDRGSVGRDVWSARENLRAVRQSLHRTTPQIDLPKYASQVLETLSGTHDDDHVSLGMPRWIVDPVHEFADHNLPCRGCLRSG